MHNQQIDDAYIQDIRAALEAMADAIRAGQGEGDPDE